MFKRRFQCICTNCKSSHLRIMSNFKYLIRVLLAFLQSKLLCTYDALVKLQSSVLQKRLQLEKEKLEMKLNNILLSQVSKYGLLD